MTGRREVNSDTYKQIILAQLHALLKPLGIRKKQALFSAERGDTVLFVQLQSSQKSTRELVIATVNLGIFSRTIAERVGNTHARTSGMPFGEKRIGRFFPEGSDKWWEAWPHQGDVDDPDFNNVHVEIKW